jgi:hypothetical protein
MVQFMLHQTGLCGPLDYRLHACGSQGLLPHQIGPMGSPREALEHALQVLQLRVCSVLNIRPSGVEASEPVDAL